MSGEAEQTTEEGLIPKYWMQIFGLVLTGLYLWAAWFEFGFNWCWFTSRHIPLNEKSDGLAGVFAPLAFLWLVLGYFLQSKELRKQIGEMNANGEANKEQAALQNEILVLELRSLALRQLSSIAADLYFQLIKMPYEGKDEKSLLNSMHYSNSTLDKNLTIQGKISYLAEVELRDIWERFERGDEELIFARLLERLNAFGNWGANSKYAVYISQENDRALHICQQIEGLETTRLEYLNQLDAHSASTVMMAPIKTSYLDGLIRKLQEIMPQRTP